MAEMTPKQTGAYHAAIDMRDFAQGRAHAARKAAKEADSQPGKDYRTGEAEWWEQRAKVADEIIQVWDAQVQGRLGAMLAAAKERKA
jgi:hypothetical protein